MFEKNPSTSIKDMLIDTITEYPRDVVEKVISFQGEDFQRAARESKEIEISGLGLLYLSKGKINRRIPLIEETISKNRDSDKKKYLEEMLEFLKKKQCQLYKST